MRLCLPLAGVARSAEGGLCYFKDYQAPYYTAPLLLLSATRVHTMVLYLKTSEVLSIFTP